MVSHECTIQGSAKPHEYMLKTAAVYLSKPVYISCDVYSSHLSLITCLPAPVELKVRFLSIQRITFRYYGIAVYNTPAMYWIWYRVHDWVF